MVPPKSLPDLDLGQRRRVRRLGFGTIHLTTARGFGPARQEARNLLRRAAKLGVNFFDTADCYGDGSAEEAICDALYPYDGITIATKGGNEHPALNEWKPRGSAEHLSRALDASLKRLRLQQISLYQLHAPDPKVDYRESIGALKELCDRGKIARIGISNVTQSHLQVALDILGRRLVSVQNYYNVSFHRGAYRHYRDTETILDTCERHGLAFIAWGPLDTGRDFDKTSTPKSFRIDESRQLDALAAKHRVGTNVIRIAALLARSNRIIAIPGTSSETHLEANMAASRIAEVDYEELNAAWGRPRVQMPSTTELRARLTLKRPSYDAGKLPPWEPKK